MGEFINLTGERFGRLVVVARGPSRKEATWKCVCDCGGTTEARSSNLRRGDTRSCGCLGIERRAEAVHRTHGHTTGYRPSRTYRIWEGMKSRCNNPNVDSYRYYGARGIQVCERWNMFENFLADMGQAPDGLSIDRINGDKDYEPGNCRWATVEEQANNTRATRRVELNGECLGLSEWAKRTGIRRQLLSERLCKGWSPERALTTPAQIHRKREKAELPLEAAP